jgi:hypothetical protein
MTQTVAIDFDGVIHAYSKGWHDGTIYDEPVFGAFAALDDLMKTYAVAIFTTRNIYQVIEWFANHGYDNTTNVWKPPFWNETGRILITNSKPAAIAYIDDRAIRFVDWRQATTALRAVTK